MKHFPSKSTSRSIPSIILLFSILALSLAACTSNQKPLIYGVWNQYDGPLSSVNRIDANGKNNAVIEANPNGLSVFQFITHHNYSSPLSPDGKYIAVYSLADDNFWELQIRTTDVEQGDPILAYPVGTELTRFIEGFSPSSKYYVFTTQDPDTGILSVQLFDVAAKTLLQSVPGAFFVDYFPASDDMVILSIGPDGTIAGVQKVTIADQTISKLYEPSPDEQIGFMQVTRDGNNLLVYDIATKILSKVEFGSGTHTTVYQYEGDSNAGNFDPNGNYLMLTDLSQAKQQVVLFDKDLAEVHRMEGIQSGYVSFSDNAQYFAYMFTATDGLALTVTDLTAKSDATITEDGLFYRSDFAPDNKHIVFIDYKGSEDKTGELYAAAVDGTQKTLLDTGVSSFIFSANNSVTYFKIGEDTANPTSTLLRIGFDGKNKVELLSTEAGIFSFIR